MATAQTAKTALQTLLKTLGKAKFLRVVPMLGYLFGAEAILDVLGLSPRKYLTGEAALEKEMAAKQTAQGAEVLKLKQGMEREALGQKFAAEGAPNPNDLLTMGSLVQGGFFDEEPVSDPNETLATFVARELGTTPQDLARKTRPATPFSMLRGE